MIDPRLQDPSNPKPTITKYRPKAIYYGSGLDRKHLARLHEIASRKGIQEYEMYIDYGSSRYEPQFRPYGPVGVEGIIG